MRRIVLAVVVLVVVLGGVVAYRLWRSMQPTAFAAEFPSRDRARDSRGVDGTLVIAQYGGTESGRVAPRQTSVYVNGASYHGLEDNDLRGFLDGRFEYGWNQASQLHVRIGRRDRTPKFGEFELFRTIQRWEGIQLPPRSIVAGARLRLGVESGPSDSVEVYLYAIRGAWGPGSGGTLGDNASPPKTGEVWWRDRRFRERSWGLPGVGYASDADSLADTGVMPLARTVYAPGDTTLVLSSERLADYCTERIGKSAPLQFLLKVSDYQEDLPGSVITVYSGDYGDSRNERRRPRLTLEWTSPAVVANRQQPIALERGRVYQLADSIPVRGRFVALSFSRDRGSLTPTIEVRGSRSGRLSAWKKAKLPFDTDWDWFQVRVVASPDPVLMGSQFRSELRNTWVQTAPPERQRVPVSFLSPGGRKFTIDATYQGDYRWAVDFVPRVPGTWQYTWTDHFTRKTRKGPVETFDVIPSDRADVLAALRSLADSLSSLPKAPEGRSKRDLLVAFSHLERAAMAVQTATSFRSDSFAPFRATMDSIRDVLGGEPVPDSIPLVPNQPPRWKWSLGKWFHEIVWRVLGESRWTSSGS